MNRRMAAGAPARALAQEGGMEGSADINLTRLAILNLGVTAEAEIQVILGKHFPVD